MKIQEMKKRVLKLTPQVKPKKQSKKATELNTLLASGVFAHYTDATRQLVAILTGETIGNGVVFDGNCKPLACVVPISGSNYEVGKPYLYGKMGMLRHADGHKGYPITGDTVRFATRKEIDSFFKRVADKGCAEMLSEKF